LSDAVVKAGGRPPVTSTQFKEIFTQAKAEREQQLGQPIPTEDAVKYGLDKGLVDEIAANEAFGALINGEGINPSDTLVAGELRKITAFFNPITGQFDKAT
ncbi:SurA N-terminal domain-containing protein, partial [Mycobacterium tuberculosis]